MNNPGIKNKGKSRPETSRDPGIWQNPVPENPGIENLDPDGAWSLVHPLSIIKRYNLLQEVAMIQMIQKLSN